MSIVSLHHVTATADEAQDDVDFCVGALGLRLVKKTVNFDNHYVYHFYYGDERGTPGTLWTTFPYSGHGVRAGTKGAGQVTVTSFSVPTGALAFWRARLADRAIAVTDIEPRFGDAVIRFADRSGLTFELIAVAEDGRRPWVSDGFDADTAIRGLHSVTMVVHEARRTVELMSDLLGYRVVGRQGARIRLALAAGGPGCIVDIAEHPEAPPAENGLGTVHHVAMAIDSADQQRQLREELIRWGCRVTEIRDRCYFQSIYFREPGGVLFEVATMVPGFTVDEELSVLGQSLKLPPWEEPHRESIESMLVPVSY